MTEPLSQDEINKLFSDTTGINKRQKLYKEFLDNNKTFNSEIIIVLPDNV